MNKPLVEPLNLRGLTILWIACCSAVTSIFLLSIESSPHHYQDEVQILDLSRTVLEPNSDWGINWIVDEEWARLTPAWLGTLLQDPAFRLTSPSTLGPRLVAMIASVLAASCFLGWLVARGTPGTPAFLLSLAFLVDPVYTNNFRGGRVDGWAIAACLSACWLLRHARNLKVKGVAHNRKVFLAGACFALSPFMWLNALLLAPLVILELIVVIRAPSMNADLRLASNTLRSVLVFGAGGVLTFAVASLPILLLPEQYWSSLLATFETQRFASVVRKDLVDLFLVHDPAIFVAAIVAVLVYRDWGLLVASVAAVLLIYQTMVYLPRAMYLIPYMLAMMASAITAASHHHGSQELKLIVMRRALALLLIWNLVASVIARPIVNYHQGPANDYQQVSSALRRAIGPGDYRVLLEEWSAYAAGRELGWKMFRHTTRYDRYKYLALLKSMDFLILRETPVYTNTLFLVDEAGFELQETIEFTRSETMRFGFGSVRFTIPGISYVPISVYKKEDSVGMRKVD